MACTGTRRPAYGNPSQVSPGALLLPTGAGFVYASGAIAIKRALGTGVSGNWVNFLCNSLTAIFFQLFWLFPGGRPTYAALIPPLLCGALFFLGQICTFRAIATGDVSIATPLLGTKVIFVALFSLLLLHHALPVRWWIASLLASVGIAFISYSPVGFHKRLVATVGWSLGTAVVFALTDINVQHWVPRIGYYRFAPVMFGTTGLLSLIYLPAFFKENQHQRYDSGSLQVQPKSRLWLTIGAFLLSIQAMGMYSAIGLYGSATLTNILYGSRCLWSVLLVWSLGSLAGESASAGNRSAVMGLRLTGALLLFAAMALVIQ